MQLLGDMSEFALWWHQSSLDLAVRGTDVCHDYQWSLMCTNTADDVRSGETLRSNTVGYIIPVGNSFNRSVKRLYRWPLRVLCAPEAHSNLSWTEWIQYEDGACPGGCLLSEEHVETRSGWQHYVVQWCCAAVFILAQRSADRKSYFILCHNYICQQAKGSFVAVVMFIFDHERSQTLCENILAHSRALCGKPQWTFFV